MKSELWQRLRMVRKYADLRQEDIAKACGISRAAVSQWEANEASKRTKPSINEVKTVARLSGVPVEWILNDAADPADVWQAAKLAAPVAPIVELAAPPSLPAEQEDRLAAAFLQAIEFSLLQRKPELATGFRQQSGEMGLKYWNGKLLLEIVPRPGNNLAACGLLLMAERAVGGAERKAVLVLGGQAENILGIDVVPVASPDAAAEYIIKHG